MQFFCSDDYYYKVFIEQILELEETALIEDYLKYLKEIHFDVALEAASTSAVVLKSDDITEIKKVLQEKEISKLFAHRFLDSLKEMLKRNGFKNTDLNIRLGEYRDYLTDKVRNISIDTEKSNEVPEKVLSMEQELWGHSFISDRNKALSRMCQSLEEREVVQGQNENRPVEPENMNGSHQSQSSDQDEGLLELLTHNRNQNPDYKIAKADWEAFNNNLLSIIKNNITNKEIRKNIVELHTVASSIKLEHASSMKDLRTILIKSQPPLNKDKSYRDEQRFLRTNFKDILSAHESPLLEMKFKNKSDSDYLKAVGQKFNTISNYLKDHMDYKEGKRIFNLSDAFRLMTYTELSVLLSPIARNGTMKQSEVGLVSDYVKITDELKKHQGLHLDQETFNPHRYIRSIIIDDLVGRAKFDAMNIFSMTLKKMENTMVRTLNNSNYNYAALSTLKLIEGFIKNFNEFLSENDTLNRSVNEVSRATSSDLPSLTELEKIHSNIKALQHILLEITNKYPYTSLQDNESMMRTFNFQNTFNKRK